MSDCPILKRRALTSSDSCGAMRKGLAVLGLSLIGVMTFDLVGAGATTPNPTITSTVNCGIGTTCTATYTIFNTGALPLAFAVLYAYGPTPAGSTVNNLPAWIPPHSASAFTVTGIARSAKTYSIDILVGHTTGKEFTDLPGGGNMPGDPGESRRPIADITLAARFYRSRSWCSCYRRGRTHRWWLVTRADLTPSSAA